MKEIFFGIRYMTHYWFSGKTRPLICGLVLHNRCNLRCRHCIIFNRPDASMTFTEALDVMDRFYRDGGRCLYLEGGEPFMWKDNGYNMEDLVFQAKKMGYLTVIIYTNGTYPLNTEADTLFVSVDGLKKTHDQLRGRSFDRIMNNIDHSDHPSLYINFTINSQNKDEFHEFLEYTHDISSIKGTFFYFHTPYYGYDDLFLNSKTKNHILDQLLELKKKYKILNSTAGLRSAQRNDWKKNLRMCQVYEAGRYYYCCRENNYGTVCKDCGYLSYAEIDQTMKLNPGAILNALKYY